MPSLPRAVACSLVLASLSVAPAESFADSGAGAHAPRHVLLKAARLFDGRSDQLLSGGVAVLVEGDRIAAVGKNLAAPADATVVDLGDATLLPGFIDAHTHLTGEASDNWYRDEVLQLMRPAPEQALYAAQYARRVLHAGFTTVRDLGSGDLIDVGLRNAIRDGVAEGPRMLVAVHMLGATGGHADTDPFPPERVKPAGPMEGVCNGADECRLAVRLQCKYGADVIKVAASGGVLSLADAVDAPQLTLEELSAIVDEAHRLGRRVAAHCHGDAAARLAIKAGVDSIEHGSFLKPDTLALMKAKGVYLVPTFLAMEWTAGKAERFPPVIQAKARAAAEAHQAMFTAALKAGVKIALGTDSAVSPHGINGQEFGLMVAAGMSPARALRAGTSSAADLLGIAADVGTLEKGKRADIVAVPGDPLADIHQTEHVAMVMQSGRQIALSP